MMTASTTEMEIGGRGGSNAGHANGCMDRGNRASCREHAPWTYGACIRSILSWGLAGRPGDAGESPWEARRRGEARVPARPSEFVHLNILNGNPQISIHKYNTSGGWAVAGDGMRGRDMCGWSAHPHVPRSTTLG